MEEKRVETEESDEQCQMSKLARQIRNGKGLAANSSNKLALLCAVVTRLPTTFLLSSSSSPHSRVSPLSFCFFLADFDIWRGSSAPSVPPLFSSTLFLFLLTGGATQVIGFFSNFAPEGGNILVPNLWCIWRHLEADKIGVKGN